MGLAPTKFPAILIILVLASCATTPQKSAPTKEDQLTQGAASTNTENKSTPVTPAGGPTPAQMIDQEFMRQQADYHFTLAEAYALEGDSARAIDEYKLTLLYDQHSPQIRLKLAAELVK